MSDEKIERYHMFQQFQTAQMMPSSSFDTLAKIGNSLSILFLLLLVLDY